MEVSICLWSSYFSTKSEGRGCWGDTSNKGDILPGCVEWLPQYLERNLRIRIGITPSLGKDKAQNISRHHLVELLIIQIRKLMPRDWL